MEDKDRVNHGRDHQPRTDNPKDVDFKESAKKDNAQERPAIKESGLGRKSTLDPANEQLESMSQIDEETKKIQQEKKKE